MSPSEPLKCPLIGIFHIFKVGDWLENINSTAAAIIRVEDEATGEVDDIIVKKEVGADQDEQDDGNNEIVEQVVVGEGKSTIQMEELSQAEESGQEVQMSEAPPNGDLTPEMILSMMDRWWMQGWKEVNTQITPWF